MDITICSYALLNVTKQCGKLSAKQLGQGNITITLLQKAEGDNVKLLRYEESRNILLETQDYFQMY